MTASPLDPAKVDRLLARVRREVDEGLLPATQIAVARDGEVLIDETFGAPPESRFLVFSATKALVAAAMWRLIDRGDVETDAPCARYLPAFGTNGKDVVTVEQVMTHTGGFPFAPLGPPRWLTREGRLEAFARWRLSLDPGETFLYHPVSGHWVLGEIIAEVTGLDHADAIEELVTAPLGLPRLLGIPHDQQDGIQEVVGVGSLPTPEEMESLYGFAVDLNALIPAETALEALRSLNDPDARALGIPGGGGVMRAADLARFYQGLLHNTGGLWSEEILQRGTRDTVMNLPDLMGIPAHRSLGLMLAGDDGTADRHGFGRTASPGAFGHDGAGGQLAFADPATGLSIVYLTSGLDQDQIRQSKRDVAIASLAADLLPA